MEIVHLVSLGVEETAAYNAKKTSKTERTVSTTYTSTKVECMTTVPVKIVMMPKVVGQSPDHGGVTSIGCGVVSDYINFSFDMMKKSNVHLGDTNLSISGANFIDLANNLPVSTLSTLSLSMRPGIELLPREIFLSYLFCGLSDGTVVQYSLSQMLRATDDNKLTTSIGLSGPPITNLPASCTQMLDPYVVQSTVPFRYHVEKKEINRKLLREGEGPVTFLHAILPSSGPVNKGVKMIALRGGNVLMLDSMSLEVIPVFSDYKNLKEATLCCVATPSERKQKRTSSNEIGGMNTASCTSGHGKLAAIVKKQVICVSFTPVSCRAYYGSGESNDRRTAFEKASGVKKSVENEVSPGNPMGIDAIQDSDSDGNDAVQQPIIAPDGTTEIVWHHDLIILGGTKEYCIYHAKTGHFVDHFTIDKSSIRHDITSAGKLPYAKGFPEWFSLRNFNKSINLSSSASIEEWLPSSISNRTSSKSKRSGHSQSPEEEKKDIGLSNLDIAGMISAVDAGITATSEVVGTYNEQTSGCGAVCLRLPQLSLYDAQGKEPLETATKVEFSLGEECYVATSTYPYLVGFSTGLELCSGVVNPGSSRVLLRSLINGKQLPMTIEMPRSMTTTGSSAVLPNCPVSFSNALLVFANNFSPMLLDKEHSNPQFPNNNDRYVKAASCNSQNEAMTVRSGFYFQEHPVTVHPFLAKTLCSTNPMMSFLTVAAANPLTATGMEDGIPPQQISHHQQISYTTACAADSRDVFALVPLPTITVIHQLAVSGYHYDAKLLYASAFSKFHALCLGNNHLLSDGESHPQPTSYQTQNFDLLLTNLTGGRLVSLPPIPLVALLQGCAQHSEILLQTKLPPFTTMNTNPLNSIHIVADMMYHKSTYAEYSSSSDVTQSSAAISTNPNIANAVLLYNIVFSREDRYRYGLVHLRLICGLSAWFQGRYAEALREFEFCCGSNPSIRGISRPSSITDYLSAALDAGVVLAAIPELAHSSTRTYTMEMILPTVSLSKLGEDGRNQLASLLLSQRTRVIEQRRRVGSWIVRNKSSHWSEESRDTQSPSTPQKGSLKSVGFTTKSEEFPTVNSEQSFSARKCADVSIKGLSLNNMAAFYTAMGCHSHLRNLELSIDYALFVLMLYRSDISFSVVEVNSLFFPRCVLSVDDCSLLINKVLQEAEDLRRKACSSSSNSKKELSSEEEKLKNEADELQKRCIKFKSLLLASSGKLQEALDLCKSQSLVAEAVVPLQWSCFVDRGVAAKIPSVNHDCITLHSKHLPWMIKLDCVSALRALTDQLSKDSQKREVRESSDDSDLDEELESHDQYSDTNSEGSIIRSSTSLCEIYSPVRNEGKHIENITSPSPIESSIEGKFDSRASSSSAFPIVSGTRSEAAVRSTMKLIYAPPSYDIIIPIFLRHGLRGAPLFEYLRYLIYDRQCRDTYVHTLYALNLIEIVGTILKAVLPENEVEKRARNRNIQENNSLVTETHSTLNCKTHALAMDDEIILPAGDESGLLGPLRAHLLTFLQDASSDYEIDRVLTKLRAYNGTGWDDGSLQPFLSTNVVSMMPEQIAVHVKCDDEVAVLSSLVYGLNAISLAEEYCDLRHIAAINRQHTETKAYGGNTGASFGIGTFGTSKYLSSTGSNVAHNSNHFSFHYNGINVEVSRPILMFGTRRHEKDNFLTGDSNEITLYPESDTQSSSLRFFLLARKNQIIDITSDTKIGSQSSPVAATSNLPLPDDVTYSCDLDVLPRNSLLLQTASHNTSLTQLLRVLLFPPPMSNLRTVLDTADKTTKAGEAVKVSFAERMKLKRVDDAMELLERRAESLNAVEIIEMLPSDIDFYRISHFLKRAFQTQHYKRGIVSVAAGCSKTYISDLTIRLSLLNQRCVYIDDERKCCVCEKPIESAVIGIFPNMNIAHFKCFKSIDLDPQRMVSFHLD